MRRQEQADFEAIYKEYYGRLFAFLYKLTGDWHTAEELTQESFYQAFRSLGSFRGECELFTWLAGIGRHVFYRWLRRKRLQPEVISPEAAADAWLENLPDDADGPAEHAERTEVLQAVRELVRTLPDNYRDVVMLRVYAGLPFAQVAAALGIRESSAKVLYFRAKEKLTARLQAQLGESAVPAEERSSYRTGEKAWKK